MQIGFVGHTGVNAEDRRKYSSNFKLKDMDSTRDENFYDRKVYKMYHQYPCWEIDVQGNSNDQIIGYGLEIKMIHIVHV